MRLSPGAEPWCSRWGDRSPSRRKRVGIMGAHPCADVTRGGFSGSLLRRRGPPRPTSNLRSRRARFLCALGSGSVRLTADLRKARVHAGRELLLVGDAREQGPQLLPLFRGERRANGVVVSTGYAANLGHDLGALLRQVNRVDASILRVVPALDEPSFLELVEQRNEPARHHAEPRGERLLADARVARNRPERSRVCWDELPPRMAFASP